MTRFDQQSARAERTTRELQARTGGKPAGENDGKQYVTVAFPIVFNQAGDVWLKPAGAVADLAADATTEDAVSKVNELLASLRGAGLLES